MGLINVESVLDLLKSKPEQVEIIITGRNAPPELIEIAHLVTEMKEIKHYYKIGVDARVGIEE
jgi:cob(I)alamin adenosyltransferase